MCHLSFPQILGIWTLTIHQKLIFKGQGGVQYPPKKVIEKRKGPCGMEMLLGNEYLDVSY